MKYFSVKANPKNFESSLSKVIDYLRLDTSKEVTLILSGGTYNVKETICFDKADFGGKCSLRIVSASNIRPTFTSLTRIPSESFKKAEGKPYYIYRFSDQERTLFKSFRTIYVNGKIADIAKTDYYRVSAPFAGYTEEDGTTKSFNISHKLYVPYEMIAEAGAENCVGAEFHLKFEWEFKIHHISKVDTEDTYTNEKGTKYVGIYTDPDEYDFGSCAGFSRCNRVCSIHNAPSTLKPGEYCINSSLGELYYYPEKDILSCEICYPTVSTLFDFKNFGNVTLQGLKFTGTDDGRMAEQNYYAISQATFGGNVLFHHAAIRTYNSDDFTINDCHFEEIATHAIVMTEQMKNITVKNSRFVNIGGSAIRIGKNIKELDKSLYSQKPTAARNVCIENNFIDSIGRTYKDSCAIIITKTENTRIIHNTILNSPYTAISLGWRWTLVSENFGETLNLDNVEVGYNYIKAFMTELADGGAVYMLGGNAPVDHPVHMNIIHDNYIIEDEKTCPANEFFASIYHDGACTNWQTSNNVVIHNPKLDKKSARLYYQAGFHPDFRFGNAFAGGAAAWNILAVNNYFCCCKEEDMYRVAPGGVRHVSGRLAKSSDMIDESRNLFVANNTLLSSPNQIKNHPAALFVTKNAGCTKEVKKGKYSYTRS